MADIDAIAPVNQIHNPPELDGPLDPNPGRAPSQTLGAFDIASFNINKMIGTGIFSTPSTILLLTGNKEITLVMWIAGWAYSNLRSVLSITLWIAVED